MTKSQEFKDAKESLLQDLKELQFKYNELDFFEDNNFEEIYHATQETDGKIERLIQSVSDLIKRRSAERQIYHWGETPEAWFNKSLYKMGEVNRELDRLIDKVNGM